MVTAKEAGAMGRKLRIRLISLLALGILFLLAQGSRIASFAAESPKRKSFKTEDTARIKAKVLPKNGYTLPIKWGNLGPTLVQLGVIDLEKFKKLYASGALPGYFRYLEQPSQDFITINPENQRFLVTVFWGLGLANKSPVLEKMRETDRFMNLASTGGWTLGAKPTTELYGKFDIIPLTPKQQELVSDLAQSIYRPCCNNPTAFPDCNHGIGLLGLIELMVAQGFNREEILKASLQFNAFWFPQHYVQTALLFELGGIDWHAVDPGEVLGSRYSSLSGWTQNVAGEVHKLAQPFLAQQGQGSSCEVSAPANASSGAAPTVKTSQETAPIHGLVLDRNNPEVHYVATYMGLVRAPRDAAAEFVGTHRFDLVGFTAHPEMASVLYASGHPDRTTYERDGIGNLGLLLSQDGGQTWRSVAAQGKAAFHALTYSPQSGGQLYGWNVAGQPGLYRISLATWAVERVPAKGLSRVLSLSASPNATGPLLAGTKTGLVASRDRGASWEPVPGLPRDVQVRAVAHHPTNGRIVYAYIAKPDFGLMRSDDGGATWKPIGFVAEPGANVLALAVSPIDNVVSVATQSYLMGISVPLPMSKKDEPYPLGGVPAVKEEMRPQKK
jgi:hypothetical protein